MNKPDPQFPSLTLMANSHFQSRKLLNDSLPTPPSNCEGVCNSWNGGNCPAACIPLCPAFCKPSIFSLPPPPPPPPCPPPPPPDSTVDNIGKPRQLSTLLIASLAVLAAAFFLFTCYTIYKFYTVWRSSSRRRRQRRQEDGDDFFDEEQMGVVDHPIWYIRTIGLQPSVINAITIVKYKKGEGLVEGTDCAVCLSEFEEDETLRLLPKCNHAFHIPCIDTWLGSHTNCPMCRAGIVSNQSGPLPQEPVSADSGLPEETRSESVSVGIEDYRSQSGVEMNEDIEEGDCKVDVGGLDGVQPSRRSVSMDSSSASMIMANAFLHCDAQRVGLNGRLSKLVESPEVERCMQTGSSSIKRSVSCSANVFTSRYSSSNRSRN